MSEGLPTKRSKNMSETLPEKMPKQMSKDVMPEDMSMRMTKVCNNVRGYVRHNVTKMCRCISNTRIHVHSKVILWMACCFLFLLAHCSQNCWLNFAFLQENEFCHKMCCFALCCVRKQWSDLSLSDIYIYLCLSFRYFYTGTHYM